MFLIPQCFVFFLYSARLGPARLNSALLKNDLCEKERKISGKGSICLINQKLVALIYKNTKWRHYLHANQLWLTSNSFFELVSGNKWLWDKDPASNPQLQWTGWKCSANSTCTRSERSLILAAPWKTNLHVKVVLPIVGWGMVRHRTQGSHCAGPHWLRSIFLLSELAHLHRRN